MRNLGFLLAAGLLMGSTASADLIKYAATLNGANENPATGSAATGFSAGVIDTIAQPMTLNVTFSGLESADTAAHIHCCVAQGGNAGVATAVPAFPGFPLGVTSGTYLQTLDLTS